MKKLWKPALLLAAIAVMAIGTLGSGAWFSDTQTNSVQTVSSGTLSINNGMVVEHPLATVTNVGPGWVSEPVTIVIENNGTMDLAWFGQLKLTGDSALANALYIDYAKMEFLNKDGNTWTDADNYITDGRGSGTYGSSYNTLADKSSFHVVTLANFNTGFTVAPYQLTGALKPNNFYRLTLKFGLAPLADNEFQNMSGTIGLTVDATQINKDAIVAKYGLTNVDMAWLNNQINVQH